MLIMYTYTTPLEKHGHHFAVGPDAVLPPTKDHSAPRARLLPSCSNPPSRPSRSRCRVSCSCRGFAATHKSALCDKPRCAELNGRASVAARTSALCDKPCCAERPRLRGNTQGRRRREPRSLWSPLGDGGVGSRLRAAPEVTRGGGDALAQRVGRRRGWVRVPASKARQIEAVGLIHHLCTPPRLQSQVPRTAKGYDRKPPVHTTCAHHRGWSLKCLVQRKDMIANHQHTLHQRHDHKPPTHTSSEVSGVTKATHVLRGGSLRCSLREGETRRQQARPGMRSGSGEGLRCLKQKGKGAGGQKTKGRGGQKEGKRSEEKGRGEQNETGRGGQKEGKRSEEKGRGGQNETGRGGKRRAGAPRARPRATRAARPPAACSSAEKACPAVNRKGRAEEGRRL